MPQSHPWSAQPPTPRAPDGRDGEFGNPENDSRWSCFQCRSRKLKCDRVKPKCGRCTRLKDTCVFPESRQKPQGKTTPDDVEDRLARLERLLAASRNGAELSEHSTGEVASHMLSGLDDDLMAWHPDGSGFSTLSSISSAQNISEELPNDITYQGQAEQLLPTPLLETLSLRYFQHHNKNTPMLHQSRYMASLHMPPPKCPPLCLQYIVVAVAAATLEAHTHLALPLYQLSRRLAEADEMKSHGEYFTTVAHAQSWAIIATFESQHLMFSCASVSLSRGLRIAQMIGLHRLDSPRQTMISTLPPPEDWCELEERRRTWWVIFSSDRFVSAVTGWPALVHEKDIATLLPASEESFEKGLEEETGMLSDAQKGTLVYSSFAGKVLSAYVYHKTLDHTFQSSPGDNPEDVKNGLYWQRHREIDTHLYNLIMYLPERLRLPQNAQDNNALFFTISVYSSTICIHRAALAKVREFALPGSMFLWSKLRLLPAADEVVNALKLTANIESLLLDHYVAFSTYLVALVYLESYMEVPTERSQSSLDFLLSSLVACGKHDLFTRSLALQLARGMAQCKVRSSTLAEARDLPSSSRHVPILAKHNSRESRITFCSILPLRMNGVSQSGRDVDEAVAGRTNPLDHGLAEDIQSSLAQASQVVRDALFDPISTSFQ